MTLDNQAYPRMSKKVREEKEKLVEELTAKCIKRKVGLEKMALARGKLEAELRAWQQDLTILKQQLQAP